MTDHFPASDVAVNDATSPKDNGTRYQVVGLVNNGRTTNFLCRLTFVSPADAEAVRGVVKHYIKKKYKAKKKTLYNVSVAVLHPGTTPVSKKDDRCDRKLWEHIIKEVKFAEDQYDLGEDPVMQEDEVPAKLVGEHPALQPFELGEKTKHAPQVVMHMPHAADAPTAASEETVQDDADEQYERCRRMNITDLRKFAAGYKIKGCWNMPKAKLLEEVKRVL